MNLKGNFEGEVVAEQGDGEAEALAQEGNLDDEAVAQQERMRISRRLMWGGYQEDMGEDVRRLW